jgi:hypothetical protein
MKRHRTDGISLVFGVVFLLVAAGRLLGPTRGRDTEQSRERR